MTKKYVANLENFIKTRINDKAILMRCLRILGYGSLMSLGGLTGFAISGPIGGCFGIVLGYVAMKLLKR
jgi:hypothetical protein